MNRNRNAQEDRIKDNFMLGIEEQLKKIQSSDAMHDNFSYY